MQFLVTQGNWANDVKACSILQHCRDLSYKGFFLGFFPLLICPSRTVQPNWQTRPSVLPCRFLHLLTSWIFANQKIVELICLVQRMSWHDDVAYWNDIGLRNKLAPTVLQLSSRLVTKCGLWNGRATQILPNTGPTGNPRISFAKVHVRSS